MDAWRTAVELASSPLNPSRLPLLMLYREACKDAHLSSQIQTALYSVLEQPFVLIERAGKQPDEARTDLLQRPWFDEFIEHALDAKYWGHSLIEFAPLEAVEESLATHEFQRVLLVPREHVKPESGQIVIYPTDTNGFSFRQTPWNQWLIEVGQPDDLGLLLKAVPEVTWKRFSRSDWSRRSEKFGMPLVVMKTSARQEAELDKKEEMLANIGANGYAMLDTTDEIEFKESGQADAYKIYSELAGFCDQQVSKLVVGQTMTADAGASLSQSEVHERILDRYVTADLRFVQKLVNFRLLPFLIAHGYPLKGYRFQYVALQPKPKPATADPATDPTTDPDDKPAPNPKAPPLPPGKRSNGSKKKLSRTLENFTAPSLPASSGGCGCGPAPGSDWHLAADTQAALDDEIERITKAIHAGTFAPGMMSAQMQQAVAKELWGGLKKGWGKDLAAISYDQPDGAVLERARANLHAFSGAKNLSQMLALRDAVHGPDGKPVPFSQYRVSALAINQRYNEKYLLAEYEAVKRAGTLGARWQDIQRDADLYPYLRYKTVGDARVRLEHQELEGITLPITATFWRDFYPPNGWNCRCSVQQLSAADVEKSGRPLDSDDNARAEGKQSVDKYWRGNAGQDGIVLDLNGHPYANALPKGDKSGSQLSAIDNYGMPSVAQLYKQRQRFPALADQLLENDAAATAAWFEQLKAETSAAGKVVRDWDGGARLLGDEFRKHLKKRPALGRAALDAMATPDEVWTVFAGGRSGVELFTVYVKWYEETPFVVLVDTARAVNSFYPIDPANISQLSKFRRGILLFRRALPKK